MKIKLTEKQKIKKENGLCIINGCTNSHGKGRNICYKHAMRRQKIKDPLRHSYDKYDKSQRLYDLKVIPFKEFKKMHKTTVLS